MKNRGLILAMTGLLFIGTVIFIPYLGTEFIPIMDEGAFDMDFSLIPGVSLDRAMEITELIERRLMEFPEMETLVSRTGQTGVPLEARGVDKTGFVRDADERPLDFHQIDAPERGIPERYAERILRLSN
jgi:cobalt-zinc-cadmium resistance protein CzcA